jgi:hypothetical protein
MSLRILGAGLVLLTLVLVGGCHSSQSRYSATCAQPGVVVASPGCNPCNTCNTAPPPGAITAVVPGGGH